MPSAADIKAGHAFVELYTKNGPLYAGLKAAQQRVTAFASGAMSYGRGLLALGGAITGPLVAAGKVFASIGDSLDEMSGRTGVSVEALSELGFAAEMGGADLATVEKSITKMQRSIVDAGRGLSTPIEGLAMLGLTVEQLQGLSPEDQFQKIADGITAIEDPTQKAAAAMMLFGRSGTQLLPMMDGLANVRQQARDLGLVVSTEDAKRAAEFSDQMDILRRVLLDGVFSAGSAVADVLAGMVMGIVKAVKMGADWIDNNRALFVLLLKIGGAIAAAGVALIAIGGAGTAVAGIFGGLATAVSVVGTVLGVIGSILGFLVGPVGLVVLGLVGLIAYALKASGAAGVLADGFGKITAAIKAGDIGGAVTAAVNMVYDTLMTLANWLEQWSPAAAAPLKWLADSFAGLAAFAGEALGGIVDALMAGDIGAAVDVMWATLKLGFVSGMSWLRKEWAELRFFLVDLWGKVAFGILDTLNYLWSGMVDGFWGAADGVVDAWKWAEESLAKGIGWVLAKLQGLNPDDVLAHIEQDYDRQQAGRDSGRAERDKANQDEADARYTAIDAAREEWMKGADAKRDAQLAGAEAGLDEARRRFADAREAAGKLRADAEAEKAKEGTKPPEKPGPKDALAAAGGPKAFAESSAFGSLEFYKSFMGSRDPNTEIRKKQLAALDRIDKNTKSGPELKEAVPPSR